MAESSLTLSSTEVAISERARDFFWPIIRQLIPWRALFGRTMSCSPVLLRLSRRVRSDCVKADGGKATLCHVCEHDEEGQSSEKPPCVSLPADNAEEAVMKWLG